MIIGLAGYARVGKDTAAKFLTDKGWTRVAFADGVRESVLTLNPWIPGEYETSSNSINLRISRLSVIVGEVGWEEAKKIPEVRRLLQVMGTEVGRDMFGYNTWVNRAVSKFTENTVITDVRFENEAKAIKDRGGIIVKISRPGFSSLNQHASEVGLPVNLVDWFLDNDGSVELLHKKVNDVVGRYDEISKNRRNGT